MAFEFLFHGKRVVVENLHEKLIIENNKLLTMIEHNAPERQLEHQEKVVQRLQKACDA